MPKELLPIVDKPIIQYAAEEAVRAGINTLIFVTGRNKRAIEDHFDANLELEAALKQKGKREAAEMVHNLLPPGVECIFVRQPVQSGLGHAVACAERAVAGAPFAVLLADDFILSPGAGVTANLVEAFEKTGNTQLSVMQIDGPGISKYGVVKPGKKPGQVEGLIEKPDFDKAPSDLASIGRYVLTPDIFDILRDLPPGSGGEIQLADAINIQAARGRVDSVVMDGNRYDCGSVDGYLDAITAVAAERRAKRTAG
ncbi:MAG: UTP--glucose-1-phosphate uridylyltransferase [Rhodobacterales bacterium]|nr:MAG: UTP--glucose-1-phosphate uridylyltransferase [Rhodobacterales bacterium]